MTLQEIDWTELGTRLRESADDAHDGQTPSIDIAYSFLLDNAELFGGADEWPAGMPQEAPEDLYRAYRRLRERTPTALSELSTTAKQDRPTAEDDYVWIRIGIRRTKNSDGWDLLCGEDKARDVSGIRASQIMYAYCDECLDALQTIVDQAEPLEPDEPDYELESDRYSGTPEHRRIG